MSARADPVAEIQDIFLQKDEIANMMLDNVFGTIDEAAKHHEGGQHGQ
jgi:hypothetical protein